MAVIMFVMVGMVVPSMIVIAIFTDFIGPVIMYFMLVGLLKSLFGIRLNQINDLYATNQQKQDSSQPRYTRIGRY